MSPSHGSTDGAVGTVTDRRHKVALLGLAVVVGIVLATVVLGVPAAAEEQAQDGGGDDRWASETRELEFQRDNDGFAFTSTRDTDRAHDVIEGRYDLETATYHLSLVDEPEEGTEGIVPESNETWVSMDLAFVELIEYRDIAQDGGFSPTSDEIVRRVPLEDYRTPTLGTTTTGNGTHVATVTFPFSSGGEFELAFHVAPETYRHGDEPLAPTVSAFDVRLNDYPFKEENTTVALHTRLSSTPATERNNGDNSLQVPPDTDQPFEGQYAWESSLDGSNTTNATIVEWPSGGQEGAASTTNVLFAYPRSDSIHHAGTVGFAEPPTLKENVLSLVGNWYVFSIALVGTTALVGGSMYVHLKEERAWPPGV